MSLNIFTRVSRSLKHLILKRTLGTFFQVLFEGLISFLFVQLPSFCCYAITWNQHDDKKEKQKRIWAKLTDESDPSSPYRALEVLDKLQDQPEEEVETLADIPPLCLLRYADKETMGIREITAVDEEKQPDGKAFKKVLLLFVLKFSYLKDFQFSFSEYKFTTYREAYAHIDAIGRGLLSIGVQPGDKVLVFSETRPEWLYTAFAAFQHSITVVTLIPTLDEKGVEHGINETKVKTVITSQELFPKFEVKTL